MRPLLFHFFHFIITEVASSQQQGFEPEVHHIKIQGSKIPQNIRNTKISDPMKFGIKISDDRITTGDIFKSIRSFVSELFGCTACR